MTAREHVCLDVEATVADGWCNHPGFRHRYGTKPTARETTLGALTAADLGKRVEVGGYSGTLHSVLHDSQYGRPLSMFRVGSGEATGMHPPTTPVTVYDEEET